MNGLKQWATDFRLSRIVSTFLVGFLLLLTVACSKAPVNSAGNPSSMSAPSSEMNVRKLETELSKKTPESRRDTNVYDYGIEENKSNVQAKTRELVDTAKRNVNETPNLEDLPGKVRRSAEKAKDDISEGLESQKNDLVKGTKNGMKNLKKNIDKASKEIPNVVQEATDNAAAAAMK